MAGQKLSPFGNALAGAIGGVISNAIVYPLDTVKTRIQAESSSSNAPETKKPNNSNLKKIILKIFKSQGLTGFYGGFGASMLNTFSMQFAYFYWYTIVRTTYIKKFSPKATSLSTATELVLGAIAGAFAQIFTIPVSVIATRQQLFTPSSSSASKSSNPSILSTAKDILAEDGVTGLWRGLKPSLVLTVNPAITYGMFERLKNLVLEEGVKMTPGKAFLIGAASKTLATVVTYPYIMAKVRLQAKYTPAPGPILPITTNGSEPNLTSTPTYASVASSDPTPSSGAVRKSDERYNGALDVLAKVYEQKGFQGWYQGMQAQITKAVISQALLFGIKDYMEGYTLLVLIAITKWRNRVKA